MKYRIVKVEQWGQKPLYNVEGHNEVRNRWNFVNTFGTLAEAQEALKTGKPPRQETVIEEGEI